MQNLSSNDFFRATPFNNETKTQIWMSILADGHDNICHCPTPFAHLLATIFPPGHQDRNLTINQILERDYKELCLSGGAEGESHGSGGGTAVAGFKGIKEDPSAAAEDIPSEELEDIFAKIEEKDTR